MARQNDEVGVSESARGGRRVSGAWGTLLTLGGFATIAAGAALVLVPRFEPRYAWSIAKLAAQGVTTGPLTLLGGLLVGFGWLARGQARLSRQMSELPDGELVLEHVAQELSSVRESLGTLDARHNLLRESTQGLIEAVQARESLSGTDADARDSIFRLAASLDRLGARLEQGELARHGEVCQALEALARRIEQIGQSARSSAVLEQAAGAGLQLESDASEDGLALGAAQVGEPTLGLLDDLDDQGRMRAGTDLRMAGEPIPQARLEELRSLLSDARVRQALDSLQLG